MSEQISITDWPRCARCDMPVEQFYLDDESGEISLVAVCHGDRQVVVIPDDLAIVEGLRVEMAFDEGNYEKERMD